MNEQTAEQVAQFLETEHSALQTARSALVAEGNGRTATFLNSISAGFVALALVFNIVQFGEVFLIFALVLIPILGLIGLSAYTRVVQLDYADVVYTVAINRIRHFYLQTTPEIAPYLSFPGFDDERSILRARVIYTSFFWTVFSYPSGLFLVINSLLAGALAMLLVTTFSAIHVLGAAGAGMVFFVLVAVLQYRLASTWLAAVRADIQPRFPDPNNAVNTNSDRRAAPKLQHSV